MNFEKIDINSIIEYENNAKIHTDEQIEQICNSIREFGNNDPIAIDENNVIIEGHGRLYALKKLNYEEVDVIRLTHLNEQQKKAYILAHNNLTMTTGFDLEKLQIEMEGIIDFDMSEFGFEPFEPLNGIEETEEQLEEVLSNIEKDENELKIQRGDIFRLGKHTLMCGDSTDTESVKFLTGGGTVNLVVTDPPYNVNYEEKAKHIAKNKSNQRISNGVHTNIENDNMTKEEFFYFLEKVYKNMLEVLEKGGSYYIWYATSETINFLQALKDAGSDFRQILIWNKNNIVLGRQDYQWKYEPCIYGWKEGAPHNWYSDRKQTTVLDFNKPLRSLEHPTMKPVDLFKYLIENSSKEGDKVLDLFGGSGTTLIACEELNRECYMIEYEPKYVEVIIKRWENLTGEKAIKIN
ncbi:site-specific DNA-methyltransferase [Parvimonas micra]|uniref:site-specific DNA-methyltransferase n=1 Tax=Parvimonas micra TaxID=33033 RepID=UPI0003F655FC|nr:site-specific DNA-methyltransferase [Parvimonas micra]